MRRGEVWWAQQPLPVGTRPVVLLCRNQAYVLRSRVTVAQVTTRFRKIPTEVPLGPPDGLPRPCVVNLDEIMTIPKRLLQRKIGDLSREKMHALHKAIHFALDLP